MKKILRRWLVVTPEYGEVIPILDYGQGPVEYVADVMEVEAETSHDAIIFGIRLMRKEGCHYFDICDNPFAGVRAFEQDTSQREDGER